MVLPLLLGLGLAGAAGAFVGSQIDDAIEKPDLNPLDTIRQIPSVSKIVLYSGTGLALFWVARKSGALKAVGIK